MNLTDPVADLLTRIRNAIERAAPESGCSGFQAEDGDCPHSERRRLHRELQGGGRRRPQDPSCLSEVWREQ